MGVSSWEDRGRGYIVSTGNGCVELTGERRGWDAALAGQRWNCRNTNINTTRICGWLWYKVIVNRDIIFILLHVFSSFYDCLLMFQSHLSVQLWRGTVEQVRCLALLLLLLRGACFCVSSSSSRVRTKLLPPSSHPGPLPSDLKGLLCLWEQESLQGLLPAKAGASTSVSPDSSP